MGWNISIKLEKPITEKKLETAICRLPRKFKRGFGRQQWGWSLAVDLRFPEPTRVELSGSYGMSGRKAMPFAKAIGEQLTRIGARPTIGKIT